MESITIPASVTSIGSQAFMECSSLTSITIPDSVTSIGDGAFFYCSSLTSITIPDGVVTIEAGVFYNCSSLQNITIPESVVIIEASVFFYCSSLTAFYGKYASSDNRCLIVDGELVAFAPAELTSYTIPEGVTSIGNSLFNDCSSLQSITIPASVTEISGSAFYNCSSLEEVYVKNPIPPTLGSYGVFMSNASGCKIYVPTESVDAYKSAEIWSEYASKIEGYTF